MTNATSEAVDSAARPDAVLVRSNWKNGLRFWGDVLLRRMGLFKSDHYEADFQNFHSSFGRHKVA